MGGCTSKVPKAKEPSTATKNAEKFSLETEESSHFHGVPEGSAFSQSTSQNGSALSGGPSESQRGQVLASPALKKQQSTSARRRLSVSTVGMDGKPGDAAVSQLPGGEVPTAFRVDESQEREPQLRKISDPALSLLNIKDGKVREVTVDMLLELIEQFKHTLCIFGSLAGGTQEGFENKNTNVGGTTSKSFHPDQEGIAFACKKGLKPESPNQDDFFIIRVDDWSLYGVFDGHGPFGHDVSSFIHRTLPYLILTDRQFEIDPGGVMKRAFRKAHHLLEAAASTGSRAKIDCSLSGTTATVVLHKKKTLVVAHVGDSRSVLGRTVSTGGMRALDLTTDHKPTRDDERRRIEHCGGEVRRLEGDIPHRVFVKDRMYPGLAMSRAIGDSVGAAVGVIPDPEISVIDLEDEDKFVIISTDGVWEFITSQEAVDYVAQKSRPHMQKAAEFLAEESWKRWVEEEENIVDDITCIIFRLQEKTSKK